MGTVELTEGGIVETESPEEEYDQLPFIADVSESRGAEEEEVSGRVGMMGIVYLVMMMAY